MKTRITFLVMIAMGFALSFYVASCKAETEVDQTVDEILAAQPTITSFMPTTASIQSKVTISGTFLNFAVAAYIGNVECEITQRINGNTLEIEVSPNARDGKIRIVTSSDKEAISGGDITITYPAPTITSTFPSQAFVNENITVEGTNLRGITRITFDTTEAIIQFQEPQALVLSVPNNEGPNQKVRYYYNTQSGEASGELSPDFQIFTPTPTIAAWPAVISRDNEVTITGSNLNLIKTIKVDGAAVTYNNFTATAVSFNIPSTVITGYSKIDVEYGTSGVITRDSVPYINGQYESYIEFDNYPASVFAIDASKDPLATQQLNGAVSQPPFPGNSYYSLEMNTGTSSTIARMKMHEETTNTTYNNIIDVGNFSDNAVLHFWINTENTEPILKIYIGGTQSANRRELPGSFVNTGNQWKLYAVKLHGFIPALTSVGGTFEFRLNTGSSASTFPVKVNMDWIIVTDKVLTEFGAIDVTNDFKPAG